jgi:hypothetical protein
VWRKQGKTEGAIEMGREKEQKGENKTWEGTFPFWGLWVLLL